MVDAYSPTADNWSPAILIWLMSKLGATWVAATGATTGGTIGVITFGRGIGWGMAIGLGGGAKTGRTGGGVTGLITGATCLAIAIGGGVTGLTKGTIGLWTSCGIGMGTGGGRVWITGLIIGEGNAATTCGIYYLTTGCWTIGWDIMTGGDSRIAVVVIGAGANTGVSYITGVETATGG